MTSFPRCFILFMTLQHAPAQYHIHGNTLLLRGEWTTFFLPELTLHEDIFQNLSFNKIDASELIALDSAGALFILNTIKKNQPDCQLESFTEQQIALLDLIQKTMNWDKKDLEPLRKKSFLYRLGEETVSKLKQIDGLIILVGDLANKLFFSVLNWKRFQIASIVSNVSSTGIQALPILALLSFLIGVVLAYQMGVQLKSYGANVFIAYLSGMAIFREFAPLITAIIVAGRTSSAFTAQIGSMKINEEIDALKTMGLSPTELLVVPKVIGLLIVFPLIIFWSDIFSILGAMIMSKLMLNVGYEDFLIRIQLTVGLKQLMLGLYKAPAFAILIALVGCHQGFRVSHSADSVGKQTTKSVVQALFLIIITDAIYSIIYSWLNL